MAKKKHQKTKVVYREKPVVPTNTGYFGKETKEKIQQEIAELEAKKKEVPSGWKGIIQRGQYNKAINERRALINTARKAEYTKIQLEGTKVAVDLQRARNELSALRNVNTQSVDFGGFGGPPKKNLSFSDLGL